MTQQELQPRVQKVFAKVFGPQLDFEPRLSRANESRWTSLKHIELLLALEQEFGVRFDGGDATEMTSVPLVMEKVHQKLS
jgi:acyl carrier protein